MKQIWAYYVTVFLSAFLLFQIQPMISKTLLPGFGGSYLVWGACMVFFQGMLLAGYIYAHYVQRLSGVFKYARLHWLLLAVPIFFFPSNLSELAINSCSGGSLVIIILRLLFVMVGVPFFVLSTTSLILQRWLSVSNLPEKSNPYILYGASNSGSMLALLSYPIIVEPFLSLKQQGYVWWIGYASLVILHVFCFPRRNGMWNAECEIRNTKRQIKQSEIPRSGTSPKPAPPRRGPKSEIFSWFLLSAAAVQRVRRQRQT
ncbi:hypothetical protein ACFLS1_00410 [Verrucomicrobiota bacterium]